MKNSIALDKINAYRNNTSVDDGANGKAFEGEVKLAMVGQIHTKNLVTSNKKAHDFTCKGVRYEVKSGCGEIIDLLNGKSKAERIIYSPIADMSEVYDLSVDNFIFVLEYCGLIRDKKTSRGTWTKSIQSFKNSRKKSAQFREMLNIYNGI